MKRTLFSFFAIMLLLAVLSFSAFAEEEPEFIEVNDISYGDGTTGFIYSDEMMMHTSYEMSADLAKVAVALSFGAYGRDSDKTASTMLNRIGFDATSYQYGKRTLDDNDHVAFVVGKKLRPEDGKMLFIVAIRGTQDYEWFSDFNIGNPETNGGNHQDFFHAAAEVAVTLDTIFSDSGVDPSNRYILFTGHSRGAAVANILAAYYTYSGVAPSDHISAYTFACPAVSKHATQGGFENIYNFNNTGDAIPTLPLASWGYRRYGIDYPCSFTASPVFTMSYYNEFGMENASMPYTASFEMIFQTLFPEESNVDEGLGRLGVMLLAWTLANQEKNDSGVCAMDEDGVGALEVVWYYGSAWAFFDLLDIIGELNLPNNPFTIYTTLKANHDEYPLQRTFLFNALNYWNSLDYFTQEDFDKWAKDNQEMIDKIYRSTGIRIQEYKDINTAYLFIDNNSSIINDFALIWAFICDIQDHSTGNFFDAGGDGHKGATYVTGINALYFGYRAYNNLNNVSVVTIPDCVKTIGYHCFANSSVTTVSGLDHVEYLGDRAFNNAAQLTTVQLGSLEAIRSYAFAGCTSLKQLSLAGVETVEAYAFQGCTALENLYIPDTVKALGVASTDVVQRIDVMNHHNFNYYGPFDGCTSLKQISVGGVETLTTGMLKTGSRVLEKLIIRGTVKNIGERALDSSGTIRDADWLNHHYDSSNGYHESDVARTELVLEEGIETIGIDAFKDCDIFDTLILPTSIVTMERHAFFECSNLQHIEFNGLSTIPQSAFESCTGLERICLETVTRVDSCAFKNCTSLVEIDFGTTVETVEAYAFQGCTSLAFATLCGDNMPFANDAFSNCLRLTVLLMNQNDSVEDYCTARRIPCVYPDAKLMLPASLTSIEDEAFQNSVTTWVLLPESIESIGQYAFADCGKLSRIDIPAASVEIDPDAFTNSPRVTIFAPEGGTVQSFAEEHGIPFVATENSVLPAS